MTMEAQEAEARITLTFKGGLADRNRLPLEQVISTLVEFQALVREVGRRAQMESGSLAPDGDFGLELTTNGQGAAFRKGSVKADFVATKDVATARIAFARILLGVRNAEAGKIKQSSATEQAVVRHMARIAAYQAPAKNSVVIQMRGAEAQSAKLTASGYKSLREAQESNLRLEFYSLYGRLLALRDRAKSDGEAAHFWGVLLADDGAVWRLKIPASMLKEVTQMFSRRVFVEGTALYFRAGSFRLNVSRISVDPERDYIKAFEEMPSESFFGDISAEDLLKELYA